MNFLLNKGTSCNRCALAQEFSVFLNLSHFCLHYDGILSAGEKYGKSFAFRLKVHFTQTEEETTMIERDSISTEKQDLNQHSDSEDMQRKKLANQGSEDRKDAKAEDIQNENVINQSGADEEDIDKNGVYHGPIVDVHAYKGNTVGGAMSSREAIEYTDNSGRVHRGFFTPEKKETSFKTDWMAVKKEFMDEFPEYRDIIDNITTNRKMWNALLKAGKDDFKTGEYKNVEAVLKTYKGLPENPVFRRMMGALFEEAFRLRNLHALYHKNGIKEGDIIAKRASAMTDVAMELGYPDLLANSYRLTLSRNGEKIPGVFIETADLDAVDKRNWTIDEPIFDMPESEFDNPRFLKSLADLQILDYLCGNIDRHSGNFFVRQDISDPKKPQLIGVQGIDNDLSFGVVIGGVQQLAKEYNLLVISSEMAEAILKLKKK